MNKLAIVGKHPDTRDLAPFDDPSFDIWVFNESPNLPWCRRWTACFQLHSPEIYQGPNSKDANHWQWLQQKHGKPIYMQKLDARVPDCVVYPLQEVIDITGMRYFTSTVCYALALADLNQYQEIHIYGVELNSNTEYGTQAECYRFWVGFLMSNKIVKLHSGKRLFTSLLYGYEGSVGLGIDYFSTRARLNNELLESANHNLETIKMDIGKIIEEQDCKKLPELIANYEKVSTLAGEYAGALGEAERYLELGVSLSDRQEFEKRFALSKNGNQNFLSCDELQVRMNKKSGCIEYMVKVWQQSDTSLILVDLTYAIGELSSLAYHLGVRMGMIAENIRYMHEYDLRSQAVGCQQQI